VVVVTVVAVDTAAADAIVAINVVTYSIAPGYSRPKRIKRAVLRFRAAFF
jgi:hypothetical protein